MAGEVVNSNFGTLNKFGASRQEIASKTATSHMREPLPPSVKNQTTVPKQKVKHCERTEKQNTYKTRKPTLKPTRCFLFFAHRTLKKRIFTASHLAHCLLPDTQAISSQKSKSQILPIHIRIFN